MISAFGLRRLFIGAFGLLGIVVLAALCAPRAQAANIIGLANNANPPCGGALLCSTTGALGLGTQGYVESGSNPFDLSTINQWFQIDTTGTSHLANQPAEPLGGAGNFLVLNDTGAVVTSFSLTVSDTFTSSTPSVTCSGSPSVCVDNFQIHGGATNYFSTFTLTGPDCVSGCGTNSANFTPGTVTYNWSGGAGIPEGATFDLNFASWNDAIFSGPTPPTTPTPEPATWSLLATALAGFAGLATWRKRAQLA